jgi:hypothetical protein
MPSPQYAGLTFRKWQFGIETSFASNNAPVTYNPLVQGHPTPNTVWEEIPHDPNQWESKILPVKTAEDWSMPLTGGAFFQTLPFWFQGMIAGGVTPTGSTAKTWTFTPNQTTDDMSTYVAEYGGNIHVWKGNSVVLREMELTFPETGGLWEMSLDGLGNSFGSNAAFTDSAQVDIDVSPSPLLGAFTKVYIDELPGNLGNTQVTGALRRGSVKFSFEDVEKKVLDGDGYAFDAVGRGQRLTEVVLTFEQTSATRTEFLHYLRNHVTTPKMRYVRLTVDGNIINGGREKLQLELPGIWTTAAFDEIGQNVVYTLTGMVKYDTTLGHGLKAIVINDKADYTV